ncbi:MAG TPA: LytTR family DNA-binding domain-containing protein [Thermoanaerobaculia bacterium]|nr:LytTR family DNA-binding domain-containing protein [Thermoanaerobaculia bacterium]
MIELEAPPRRCLIVDDEPLARRVLETYVAEHPVLALAGSCGDAVEALAVLQSNAVDILFVDIQMPKLDGLALVRALPRPPAVVFTTAHSAYAVEAFDVAASDYLLKPVSRERFVRAVARIVDAASPARAPRANDSGGSLYLRVDQQLIRVAIDDIDLVEACENYVRVHTARRAYLTKRTLTDVEASLPPDRFLRVHRSFVVNLGRIERLDGATLDVRGRAVPVSRNARNALLERLPRL